MPIAKTLPRPAASGLAAPVKVAGGLVVTVPLDLAVAEAMADSVQLHSSDVVVAMVVATTDVAGAAELVAGAAEEAELAGAADEAGAAELEPPALSAAQAAWAFVRVAVDISLVYARMNGIVL